MGKLSTAAKIASKGLKAKKGENVVNIGLEMPGGGALDPQVAKEALRARGVNVVEYQITDSASEPTLVAVLDRPLSEREVFDLSAELGQDAIAGRFGEEGILAGPKAEDWGGAFNPDYFLEPDFNLTRRDTELGALAERYPEVGEPVLKTDPKTGKQYLAKGKSEEGIALEKARAKARKDMQAEGYEPFFDPAERYYADPTSVGERLDTSSVKAKKPETVEAHRAAADTPEVRERLRGAIAEGMEDPNAEDWYAMGQLQDAARELAGDAAAGDELFTRNFSQPMAATTGGADPTANWLTSGYANFMRESGQTLPQTSYELPAPVGGRFISGNLGQYEKIINRGEGLGLGNPKRYNFFRNFEGDLAGPTLDEQMMLGMSGGKLRAPPQNQYGIYEDILVDEAQKMGREPARAQDVAWKGFKGVPGKPMIEHFNESVERTHRVTGQPRAEIVEGFLTGRTPAYVAAGATVGGLLATPEENDAMAAGLGRVAGQLVKRAEDIRGKVRRGTITPEQGMRYLTGDVAGETKEGVKQVVGILEELNRKGGRVVSPEQRTAAADAIYGVYEELQGMGPRERGVDVRGEQVPADVATEALPQLADRPYTPEEEAGYQQWKQLTREMGEVPYAPSLSASGQHYADPFNRFQPQPAVEIPYLAPNTPSLVGANNPKLVYTGTPAGAAPAGSSGIPAASPAEIAARPTGVVPPTKPLSQPGAQTYYNPETGAYDLPAPAGRPNPVRAVAPYAAAAGLGALAAPDDSQAGVLSDYEVGPAVPSTANTALEQLGHFGKGLGQFVLDAGQDLIAKTAGGLTGVGMMAHGVATGDPKTLREISEEMNKVEGALAGVEDVWWGDPDKPREYENLINRLAENPHVMRALEWLAQAPDAAGDAVAGTFIGRHNPSLPAVTKGAVGALTEIL